MGCAGSCISPRRRGCAIASKIRSPMNTATWRVISRSWKRAATHRSFEHLVYASSSSVYGDKPMGGEGFTEDEPATNPVSLYAATKRSCELMNKLCEAIRLP